MDSFLIQGGTPLRGTIDVSGAKNAALPILSACLMASGVTRLHGVPRLSDIDSMIDLLRALGCRVTRHENAASPTHGGPSLNGPLDIEVTGVASVEAGYDIVSKMRASISVLGPLLAARGHAVVSLPGGCAIGDRPVDLHLRGLRKLGAEFDLDGGNIVGTVPGGRLKGCRMYLGGASGPTVLGTINVMCAAALAEGETVIVGAACEPEVADTAALLNKMGAKITGQGTPEIKIEGVERLNAAEHRIIPDRIEAATFIIAAAMTGGDLKLTNCNLNHLVAVVDQLETIGVKLDDTGDAVRVTRGATLSPVELTTQPYPGFPTDVQAQLVALLSLADGMSVIGERIFPERFQHLSELNRLGAHVRKEGSTAFIHGVKQLKGATVMASDLRASAALVLAGLVAQGTTKLNRVYHIDRGYEKIEQKLKAVGAKIERVNEKS